MRVSFSALETYKICPFKFKCQELDKIKAPKAAPSVFGSCIHSALKRMFERTPLYPALDEVIDFFTEKWSSEKEIFGEEVHKIYFDDGISMLKDFYKRNPPWNFNAVELESRFETVIENNKNANKETHILVGKMDRLDKLPEDGAYEIIDYKTSKRMPSQNAIDKDLQLSIYNLGLLKRWPHLKPLNIKLSHYYLKHNEKIETKRTSEDLENTKIEILSLINEIQNLIKNEKEFIPTPSGLCDHCGYRKICPMWKHLYEKSQISNLKSQNDIEPLIEEFFALKNQTQQNNRRISEINAQISEFMTQMGLNRVFGENGYLTRILLERTSYDMPKIKQILEGLNLWNEVAKKKQFSSLKATKKKITERYRK